MLPARRVALSLIPYCSESMPFQASATWHPNNARDGTRSRSSPRDLKATRFLPVEIHWSDHEESSPRNRRASHSRPPGSAQNLGTCSPCGRRHHRPRRRTQRPTRPPPAIGIGGCTTTARLAGRPGRKGAGRHRRRPGPASESQQCPGGVQRHRRLHRRGEPGRHQTQLRLGPHRRSRPPTPTRS